MICHRVVAAVQWNYGIKAAFSCSPFVCLSIPTAVHALKPGNNSIVWITTAVHALKPDNNSTVWRVTSHAPEGYQNRPLLL